MKQKKIVIFCLLAVLNIFVAYKLVKSPTKTEAVIIQKMEDTKAFDTKLDASDADVILLRQASAKVYPEQGRRAKTVADMQDERVFEKKAQMEQADQDEVYTEIATPKDATKEDLQVLAAEPQEGAEEELLLEAASFAKEEGIQEVTHITEREEPEVIFLDAQEKIEVKEEPEIISVDVQEKEEEPEVIILDAQEKVQEKENFEIISLDETPKFKLDLSGFESGEVGQEKEKMEKSKKDLVERSVRSFRTLKCERKICMRQLRAEIKEARKVCKNSALNVGEKKKYNLLRLKTLQVALFSLKANSYVSLGVGGKIANSAVEAGMGAIKTLR